MHSNISSFSVSCSVPTIDRKLNYRNMASLVNVPCLQQPGQVYCSSSWNNHSRTAHKGGPAVAKAECSAGRDEALPSGGAVPPHPRRVSSCRALWTEGDSSGPPKGFHMGEEDKVQIKGQTKKRRQEWRSEVHPSDTKDIKIWSCHRQNSKQQLIVHLAFI